ncbi:PTS mannitol transporter subunit IICB [Aureibacillus halotolerans]|uniref:PTS system mannitol-specific EIICB component n=1 Tax=Aureibacillus halotolerans TaxID=1508390 RepID=A0A4R6TWV4_9BACI|nr:PTS mannitol transporter subunit IICB [Aureibacillus halotolerans]TDQ37746.1 PTS system mannitol-specific IIC component [Aureibacillus halotolerans]
MAETSTLRLKVQKFGNFLSSMIMPNIGAFIAWGIITALFIADGYWPNEKLAALVGPMINYLLPLLIAYTGGKLMNDVRGGVVGAIAAMGVIVGSDIPMFLGAMIVGPLGGYLLKLVDRLFLDKVKTGFEMLYNNFSAGILGAVLAVLSLLAIGPAVITLQTGLATGLEAIVAAGLLPLTSLIVEPAKILFLNNAVNHGIFTPIATAEAAETGKSILYLIEPNPGPGLGVLLAFTIFGKGASKSSAPGAAVIQFFGGIHEIYFPYVLMKPMLLLAVIAGGMSGVFTFALLDAGLQSAPSPGSIFALIVFAPNGGLLSVLAGVLVATVVSFLISAVIIRAGKGEDDLAGAADKMQSMKGKKSSVSDSFKTDNADTDKSEFSYANVNKVVFACDAGMGSSAMGASLLRKKFKEADIDIPVTNTAINQLPDDADIVITHKDLTSRARDKRPDAHHISVDNFLNSPAYEELANELKK